MSDTDRPGTSPESGVAKARARRSRAASQAVPPKAVEDASDIGPKLDPVPADKPEAKPVTSDSEAAFDTDRASRKEVPDALSTPTGLKEETAPPPDEVRTPSGPGASKPEARETAPPWRHVGQEPPSPASPPSPPKGARTLALAALLLSLIVPGALFAYLAASGIFDRVPERLAQVESAVDTMRTTPSTKPEVTRADLDKLAGRVDALEKALAAQGQRPSPAASLEALAGRVDAASRDAKEALTVAKSAADSANGAQPAAARLAEVESKLTVLEKDLARLEQSVAARPKPDANAPSILVMARAIEADLNRGSPFAGELDALSRLGADSKLVDALRPFAEKGAPSPASLVVDFENELEAAREKVAETSQPANWWDRLLAFVGRIVRVRHVGIDEAGSPAATVEAALMRGDIGAARDAWEALPVFEKGATPHSGARIKALAEASAAARRISTGALDAIRRSSSTDSGG
ncbi:MAG: hypothetical protein JOZ88_14520 [Hyphomicrobiales bacterium]|nr:hypothetical protein [Hyphomicrobiales bacterium]